MYLLKCFLHLQQTEYNNTTKLMRFFNTEGLTIQKAKPL